MHFFSKKTIALLITTMRLFSIVLSDTDVCVEKGDSCKQDCDCCGFSSISGVVCQTRRHHLGPRCYIFRRHGEPCEHNDECRSQNCVSGICQSVHSPLVQQFPPLCPITLETDDLTGIVGQLTTEANTCACTDSKPFPEEPCENILMKKPYVNNYPINSGFTVTPTYHFPLRKLVFCTSSEDPAYDPSCFKLEGRCRGSHEFQLVSEGALRLPLDRNQCKKIHIPDQDYLDRREYEEFKLTFPCQRGGFTNTCTSGCQDYPVRLDMIRLMGNCRDRNYCKLETSSLFDVTGSYWEAPAGACANCMHSNGYPLIGAPGKTIDGTITPYINYKAIGSGLIYERVEKPVNLIRIYPSSFDSASDPISYEVYGAKYQQDYQLLGSGLLNFPDERNMNVLKHYTEIFLNNNVHYKNIKIMFLDVEGNFDIRCGTGETCKDYPLIIGEIELYGWC